MSTIVGELASLCAKAILLAERGERGDEAVASLLTELRSFTEGIEVSTEMLSEPSVSPEAALSSDHDILSKTVKTFQGWKACEWLIYRVHCRYIGEMVWRLLQEAETNQRELEEVQRITGLRDPESVHTWRPGYWDNPAFLKALDTPLSELSSHNASLHRKGIFFYGSLLRSGEHCPGKRLSHEFHLGALVLPDWVEPPPPANEAARAANKKEALEVTRQAGIDKTKVTRELGAELVARFPKLRGPIGLGKTKFLPFVGELLERLEPGTSAAWIAAHQDAEDVNLVEVLVKFGQHGDDEHPCWRTIKQPTRERVRNVLSGIRKLLLPLL